MPCLGRWLGLALAASSLVLVSPTATAAHAHGTGHGKKVTVPTLVGSATLSADFLAPGPPSGAQATPANGRQGPFAGQVVPGFSAVVEAGDGTYWAQPDNGFGAKTNSADFLLRIYRIRPDFGTGEIAVESFLSLRDPDRRAGFPIVHEDTPDRLLTGADFDVESLVRAPDGTFWVGEEFGPYVLHVDATGKLLQAPIPLPDAKSPQNPTLQPGEAPRVGASKGFEAMAASRDGRYLYPVLEGALLDDADQRRRWVLELDTRTGRYTGRRWAYQVGEAGDLVADAFTTRDGTLLVLERDNLDGAAAVTKRVYEVDLRRSDREGDLEKTLVVDLLKLANPDRLGYGQDPYAFPYVSVETIVQLRDGRLLTANDNNYPGDDARVPGTPDDTELAVIDLRRVRAPREHTATLIGHRGSSGTRPEHTLAAYEQAILACADFIEPDVVTTKDGVLVARHEPEIGGTTDVASHPEFADRRTTKSVDGTPVTGWFAEDFTLAELKTLRANERLPQVRPQNTAFDGLYAVPTLDEVLDLARHSRTCDGDPVGVYVETKHPAYFREQGLGTDQPLLDVLAANGIDARYPAYVQSFETNLRALDRRTDVQLVQLVDCGEAERVTRSALREISRYADGVGPCKDLVIPRDAQGRLLRPTALVRDAHRSGLVVHPFTFRVENQFLPAQYRDGTDPSAPGDLVGELRAFLRAGVDGFFTDNPAIAARVVG